MAKSRRQFLRIAGSSAVILAAGATGFAVTRTPTKALAPWHEAGHGYSDARKRALSYAILAPNPHNQQPWLVSLEGDDTFTLSYDLEQMLPATDPFNRQIVIGLGCFLELMRMAAASDGYRADVALFPQGEPEPVLDGRPIAQVTLVKDAGVAASPLFAQVLARRSNKEPYDTSRPVAAADMQAIAGVAGADVLTGAISDDAMIETLRDLTWRAHLIEVETPATYMESVDVMRFGKAEIEANPDGIDLGGAFLETLGLAGVMTRETLSDMTSIAYDQGLDMYRGLMSSAMGYVYLATARNTRLDQVASGRDWLRMNLKATELGIAMQPLSQALQEYVEMDALYAEVHEVLGHADNRLQMLARVGYGPDLPPSPRWPITAKIV
ncbi:twin-arginine translocation pathway signal protein [Pyruvatibacter sp.]|uniref:Acg family FMN-binding oxidoreductase n=1 Tax=Pyruvatibacter sp. TaxID=1981328 RepID=UPI0032ED52C8